MLSLIYNYFSLIYNLYNFNFEDAQEYEVDFLYHNIIKCGSTTIKMFQWSLPILEMKYNINRKIHTPYWLVKLENLYDNCNYHSIDYTKEIFYKSFNQHIEDDFDIVQTLSSGSMGACYLIKNKDTNKKYCMKVIHPNIDYEIKVLYYLLKILPLERYFKRIIPISLKEFYNDFTYQTDLIKESNNIMHFKDYYKNNKLIHIPEVYKSSKNVLIMEYIPSKKFENCLDLSEYKKKKLAGYLYLFIRSNALSNFNHGDLHKGNWGISLDDKGVVIYDMGICWKINRSKHKYIIDVMELFDGDYTNNIKLFDELAVIVDNLCDINIDKEHFKEYANRLRSEFNMKTLDPLNIYHILIKYLTENNLILDYNVFSSLIMINQVSELFLKYFNISDISKNISNIDWYKYVLKDLCDICKSNDCFQIFYDMYSKKLSKIVINEDYKYIENKITLNLN